MDTFGGRRLAILDALSDTASVWIAQRREDGRFRLLGSSEGKLAGVRRGRIEHLADAAEAVGALLRRAEEAAHCRIKTLYFNFDDQELSSCHLRGARQLNGESEIRAEDVADVCRMGERLAERFGKSVLYSSPAVFVIDDRDEVDDPHGVVGRKLNAVMHIVQANSESLERWQRVMDRCFVERAVPVFASWAVALGVLEETECRGRKMVAEAAGDVVRLACFSRDRVVAYRSFSPGDSPEVWVQTVKALAPYLPETRELLVTGENRPDEAFCQRLSRALGWSVECRLPAGVPELNEPYQGAVAGLLRAGDRLEKENHRLHRSRQGWWQDVRQKTGAWVREYF